jgi:hypothetical protein
MKSGFAYPALISQRQSEVLAYRVSWSVVSSHGMAPADDKKHPIDLSTDQKIIKFLDSLPKNPKEDLNAPIYHPPL